MFMPLPALRNNVPTQGYLPRFPQFSKKNPELLGSKVPSYAVGGRHLRATLRARENAHTGWLVDRTRCRQGAVAWRCRVGVASGWFAEEDAAKRSLGNGAPRGSI